MKLNIDFNLIDITNEDLNTHYRQVEDAIDELWSDSKEEYGWVKRPMSIGDNELEDLIMTALAAQDTCGIFVVIGEKSEIIGAKAIIEAIGTKRGAEPEVEFVDESISSVDLRKLLEKMRHYEVNACVISRDGERRETIASYSVLREYMENRYGKEVAPRRIMIVSDNMNGKLATMAGESGSGVFNFFSSEIGSYSIISTFSLFLMAVAGVDIKRFVSGCEVMATDSLWDINGGDLAIARKILSDKGFAASLVSFRQKNFEPLCQWMQSILSTGSKGNFMPTFLVDETSCAATNIENLNSIKDKALNITLSARSVEENISLAENLGIGLESMTVNELKDICVFEEREVLGRLSNNFVDLEIDMADAFSLGQLTYYVMMIGAISSILGTESQ